MPRRRRGCSAAPAMRCSSPPDLAETPPPAQRNAANARERARMRVLSKAFCRLKTTLPWVPADTKLSKLDTLRLATSYIAHLRAALAAEDSLDAAGTPSEHHPLNLTWPFTFQHNGAVGGGGIGGGVGGLAAIARPEGGGVRECPSPPDSEYSPTRELPLGSYVHREYHPHQYMNAYHEDSAYETNNEWHHC